MTPGALLAAAISQPYNPCMSNNSDTRVGERQPFELGDWMVEPMLDRISRGHETVQLRPRVMDLLISLVESPEKVVSRRQLIDRVWRTRFVTDNALTRAITELRKKLGDDAKRPAYIETIPKRGYRIVAEVGGARVEQRPAACRFLLEEQDETEVPLRDGDNIIGRSAEADVQIDASEVSRRHARILVVGSTAVIEDLGSKNGTFVRGSRIDAPVRLEHADVIQIGVNVARFRFKVIDDRTKTERGEAS